MCLVEPDLLCFYSLRVKTTHCMAYTRRVKALQWVVFRITYMTVSVPIILVLCVRSSCRLHPRDLPSRGRHARRPLPQPVQRVRPAVDGRTGLPGDRLRGGLVLRGVRLHTDLHVDRVLSDRLLPPPTADDDHQASHVHPHRHLDPRCPLGCHPDDVSQSLRSVLRQQRRLPPSVHPRSVPARLGVLGRGLHRSQPAGHGRHRRLLHGHLLQPASDQGRQCAGHLRARKLGRAGHGQAGSEHGQEVLRHHSHQCSLLDTRYNDQDNGPE